tara:strand:- start:811 stop:1611 length:801 start_codon:yes stop_codon:yes gene_type:complete
MDVRYDFAEIGEVIMKPKLVERYSKHLLLKEIGGTGQKKLLESRILVVGLGGLGCPLVTYLVAAGVGSLGIIDHDVVSLSNLQRQPLYSHHSVGRLKVDVAKAELTKLNPSIEISIFPVPLTHENSVEIIKTYDFVIEGTDSHEVRYIVNTACLSLKKPFVSGAISRWEGQIGFYNLSNNSPCYKCIFPNEKDRDSHGNCQQEGVVGPLPGIIGTMMAGEVIKFLIGAENSLDNQLLCFDLMSSELRKFKMSRRSGCETCSQKPLH